MSSLNQYLEALTNRNTEMKSKERGSTTSASPSLEKAGLKDHREPEDQWSQFSQLSQLISTPAECCCESDS